MRRLICADWVLPVDAPPLQDGAVLVDGELVAEVGSAADLAARHPDATVERFAGCVATPGLVNAHTHLTLTGLAGAVPPMPFAEWLPGLVSAMKPWTVDDHEASGESGARECLLAGVSVVGDIAYGAAEVAKAAGLGLGGVYYWELLGMQPEDVAGQLEALRYPRGPETYGARVSAGLSPHSPYTAGPALLQAVHALAAEKNVPLAIHVAESTAEVELLRSGTGPLAPVAARTAHGFSPPGTSTVRYLADVGALPHATAVHCCHVDAADIELLAAQARGVVTCPRSNRYLGNPVPDISAFLDAGIAVGVGTDSSASNHDLDLVAELRALHAEQPDLSAQTLVEMATLAGARAIGAQDSFGSLTRGKQADIALFELGATDDPYESVVEHAGTRTLRALMTGGAWRVRDGALLGAD